MSPKTTSRRADAADYVMGRQTVEIDELRAQIERLRQDNENLRGRLLKEMRRAGPPSQRKNER